MLIAISGQYHPSLVQRINSHYATAKLETVLNTSRAKKVTTLITRGGLSVDEALLDRLPCLQKIIKAGSGLDTIDTCVAQTRNIFVVATGGSEDSVADLAIALLFSCLRYVPYFDKAVRRGSWDIKSQLIGNTFASRHIGVVGYGRIGQVLAEKSRALGALVSAWDPSIANGQKGDLLGNIGVTPCRSLSDLISCCDVISLHVPLLTTTTSLIGHKELTAMSPNTVIINTSRANVIDHKALFKALSNGSLHSAGLDVHYCERKGEVDPLFTLPNVVLTPHVGAQSEQSQKVIADRILLELNIKYS